MRTSNFETIQRPDGGKETVLPCGRGVANTLCFMLSGFRDWRCFGVVPIKDSYNFGTEVDGVPLCAVYGKRDELELQCDGPRDLEQEQIDAGMTAILLFKGCDNSSQMRRMRPEDYDVLVLTSYNQEDTDLFYNS